MNQENIQKEFLQVFYELAYGFKEKHKTKALVCPYLNHAINQFSAFALKYGMIRKGKLIAPQNETDAIENWFSVPAREWLDFWWGDLKECLKIYRSLESLIDPADGIFIPTEACDEYAMGCIKYNQNTEQQLVFLKLREIAAGQDAIYTYCRKFLIEHPIVSTTELGEMKETLSELQVDEDRIQELIALAYEPIPAECKKICKCGWTPTTDRSGRYQCIHEKCRKYTSNFRNITELKNPQIKQRLKRGVMRYMVLPGKVELDIANYFQNKSGYEAILWPKMDKYDLQVKLPNGKNYIIDAKDYKSPFALGFHLLEQDKLLKYQSSSHQVVIVVSDEVAELKRDYTIVVNKIIKEKYGMIPCITYSELMERIEREDV